MIIGVSRASAAALPSTNMTMRFDFSDITTLFKTFSSGSTPSFSNQASADGDVIRVAKTVFPAPNSEYTAHDNFDSTTAPIVKITSPGLARQCLKFDGSNDMYHTPRSRNGDGDIGLSSVVFGASAKTCFIVFRLDALPSSGNLFSLFEASSGSWWAMRARESGGNVTVQHETHAGGTYIGADTQTHLAINTNYVACGRHDGVNIKVSVNNDTEQSAACGASDHSYDGGLSSPNGFLNGRIGEIVCYNAVLSGSDLSNAYTYLMNKWL